MMGLAGAMAGRGHKVYFFASEELSKERRNQGWKVTEFSGVEWKLVNTEAHARELLCSLPSTAIHITQGIRGNGLIKEFQKQIIKSGQRHWIVMETVEDAGWRGLIKRIFYRVLLRASRKNIEGILAIGDKTADWIAARGYPATRTFPFAYFIDPPKVPIGCNFQLPDRPFTFIFVGNLEPWKSPWLALNAFLRARGKSRRLVFVGDGSLRKSLESACEELPTDVDVSFSGRLPMQDVPASIAEADCLLLTSDTDGWGVVASEAMLLGTPVIASDACGVSGAVRSAPGSAVFRAGDLNGLIAAIEVLQSRRSTPDQRGVLEKWARPLSADFGAGYLESILEGVPPTNLPYWLLIGANKP